MSREVYRTANSHTKIVYDTDWRVLDLGSGHNPHPRADVLLDRYLRDDTERSGKEIEIPGEKLLVAADACAMPFRDKSFDFVIASHVAEHVEGVDAFCSELIRVGKAGYLETPSKFAEVLRHAPNHRWYVDCRGDTLVFARAPNGYPLGWFGKLFFSAYFYGTRQVLGRDVFRFSLGCSKPWHYLFTVIRWLLVRTWLTLKPLTYTRLRWTNTFSWRIAVPSRNSEGRRG